MPQPVVADATDPTGRSDSLRRVCLIDYALHIAGPLLSMGFLSVIALIVTTSSATTRAARSTRAT
jgi:hypothetical protein